MALLDDELPEPEKKEIQNHLHCCSHCSSEYHHYRELLQLTDHLPPPPPQDFSWQNYWGGVCQKMETRATWPNWMAGSLALVLVGNLMLFGFPRNFLAHTLAVITLMAGVCLLWMSHFCNCGKRH